MMSDDEIKELAKKKGWRYDSELGLVFDGPPPRKVGGKAVCPDCGGECKLTRYADWLKAECTNCEYVGDATIMEKIE